MMEASSVPLLAQFDDSVLRMVQDLFRSAARRIRTRLINLSTRDVPVRLGTAHISTLRAALDTLQGTVEAAAFARFRIEPGGVPGLMVLHGPLLNRLVGALLGDDSSEGLFHHRSLTQVDLRVARRVCQEVLHGMTEACVLDTRPVGHLEAMSAHPTLSFAMPQSTTVVEVSLDFGRPDDPFGLLTVIVPGQASGVLWPSRRVARRFGGEPDSGALNRVLPVQVEASAELARIRTTLGALRKLEIGSVLDLGPLRDVAVRVGGQTVLTAEAGESEGIRSIRVVGRN